MSGFWNLLALFLLEKVIFCKNVGVVILSQNMIYDIVYLCRGWKEIYLSLVSKMCCWLGYYKRLRNLCSLF